MYFTTHIFEKINMLQDILLLFEKIGDKIQIKSFLKLYVSTFLLKLERRENNYI